MIINVAVKPGSAEQEISKTDDRTFVIRLKSRAENNKANIELVKLLAKYFNTQQKNILIAKGKKSRKKIVETSKMLFVYPTCFNSQRAKAFLIVLKNPSTPCALAQGS